MVCIAEVMACVQVLWPAGHSFAGRAFITQAGREMMFRLAQRQLQGGALPKLASNRWMSSLSFDTFGEPSSILKAGKSVAVEEPSAGQVKVTLKASPVTFEDIRSMRGLSVHCSHAGVAGTYGVGTVSALGSGVEGVSPSSQVLVASSSSSAGTWTSEALFSSQDVFPIDDSTPLDPAQAACLPEAAAAWALLHTFVSTPLCPGDVVLRSAESSTLNSALDQLAAAGGFVVVPASASDLVDAKFKEKLESKGPVRLAITSGTGKSARAMHALTGSKGVLVTYNGAIAPLAAAHDTSSPFAGIEVPSLSLIFQDKAVCGFDFRSWAASSPIEATHAIQECATLMRNKKLKFSPVAFKATQFKDAVECVDSGKCAVLEL